MLRARARVAERLPERSQQACLRALGDERVRALGERFADSFERGDVEAILALLTEDATFQMPPFPDWRQGKEAIADSWLMPVDARPGLRYVETRVNGQLAFGAYLFDPHTGAFTPIALDVLTLEPGGMISSVAAFRDTHDFGRLGLPATIDACLPRRST